MLRKFLYGSAVLVGLTIPLSTKIANISIICFVLLSLTFCYQQKFFKPKSLRFLLFSSAILFLLAIIGIFIADDIGTAQKHMGRRVLFLLMPISFCFLDKDSLKNLIRLSFTGLVIGSVLSGIYLLLNTLHTYFGTRGLEEVGFDLLNYYHTYHNFTKPLNIHPTYLGSYLYISLIFVFIKIAKKSFGIQKILGVLTILFLILIEIFINSRIILFLVVFSLFLFCIWFLYHQYKKNKLHFLGYILTFAICMATAFTFLKNTYIYYRFTDELVWETSSNINTKINTDNGGDSRIARWKSLTEVVKQRPILGHGTGNEKELLETQFIKDNLMFSAESKYDSHNQYLSYTVQFGVVGLLCFMFYLVGNLFVSIRNENFMLVFVMFGILMICCFENFLNNNAGIIFVAFFQNILLIFSLKER